MNEKRSRVPVRPARHVRGRRGPRAAAAALLATAALASSAAAVQAEPRDAPGGAARHADPDGLDRRQLQQAVERTLRDAGFVSVSVEVRDGRRRVHASAGQAELGTGRAVPRNATLRTASSTKAFVATVVLQLVGEGELSLDDTVEEWLPGVVAGNGNDGSRITVRHLLQHTSGIHNHDATGEAETSAEAFERHRFDHVDPEQIVAGAVAHQPDFPPADPDDPEPRWSYSNPNYVLAGLIIQRVTGNTWEEEVESRIIEPLGLTGTYAPGDEPTLPEPHAHTYQRFPGSLSWTDTTTRNMSWAGAAGALVTTQHDLDRFFTALVSGRLLDREQLAEMRRVVPVPEDFQVAFPGLRYGLGLMEEPLTCGGVRWGHGGDLAGGTVRVGVTDDGRRSVVLSASGKTGEDEQLLAAEAAMRRLVDTALCEGLR
ncbi:serine hydrolase [Wenjunlia vitaminophila]|uniref:Serine hydrolase n=1 Tax=Wenjunlia vitaminophila TaxID=76728 RepID=A0A0T6LQ81_WENVI|nr:serine hydrolase domain-containing protein [Wenjunlia vitaminophila]KRV48148.1 serine hydrolase [Wenjunlia vitaminophila]